MRLGRRSDVWRVRSRACGGETAARALRCTRAELRSGVARCCAGCARRRTRCCGRRGRRRSRRRW
jgi:hypothetical protein